MKKLLLLMIATATLSYATQQAEVVPYNQELIKKTLEILEQPSFQAKLKEVTAHRPTPGARVTYMQSLVIEELKKQKFSFDEIEARSLIADLGIVLFMSPEQTTIE